jgi:hypothetical protein
VAHRLDEEADPNDLVVRRHFDTPLGTHRRLRFLLIVTQPLTEEGLRV